MDVQLCYLKLLLCDCFYGFFNVFSCVCMCAWLHLNAVALMQLSIIQNDAFFIHAIAYKNNMIKICVQFI
jgi:hypothetical protein